MFAFLQNHRKVQAERSVMCQLHVPCHSAVLLLSIDLRTKSTWLQFGGKQDGPASCGNNPVLPIFVVTKTDILSA